MSGSTFRTRHLPFSLGSVPAGLDDISKNLYAPTSPRGIKRVNGIRSSRKTTSRYLANGVLIRSGVVKKGSGVTEPQPKGK